MKKIIITTIGIITALIISLLLLIILSANPLETMQPVIGLFGPDDPFRAEEMQNAPDYSQTQYWAALPNKKDAADMVPKESGYQDQQGSTRADVFYIHPTGYIAFDKWTENIQAGSWIQKNTIWFLANEASIFNSCCDIYAPRYRQASIFSYVGASEEARHQVLDAVYADIESAFEYFITNHNKNRPFIIVGHSQGTHMAMRLIENQIDGTELAKRMIAAYLPGSLYISLSNNYLSKLSTIHACKSATDTQCIVHWETFSKGGIINKLDSPEASLCTNPLTWQINEEMASAEIHLGAVPAKGRIRFNPGSDGENTYEELDPPMPNYTWAQCENGTLYVENQKNQKYIELGSSPDNSYHGVDFLMFHVNIRENSLRRVDAYYDKRPLEQ